MISGIYSITDATGRKYVGSSGNISKRFTRHRWQLSRNCHPNKKLQNAWNKYGAGYFSFDLLEVCYVDELVTSEQFFLDTENPHYNILNEAYSVRGLKHSEEFKEARRSFRHSDETKKRMSEARKGRKFTEEHKKNLSASQKGKTHSEETKRRLSEAGILRGAPLAATAAATEARERRKASGKI